MVLGLLLSSNAYAKEIYLTCKSYRGVGYWKDGRVSEFADGDTVHYNTFKINTDKKRIYDLNPADNEFIELKNVDWNWETEAYISWKENFEGLGYINICTINRIESTFLMEIIYKPIITFKRLVIYSNCKVGKKKF